MTLDPDHHVGRQWVAQLMRRRWVSLAVLECLVLALCGLAISITTTVPILLVINIVSSAICIAALIFAIVQYRKWI